MERKTYVLLNVKIFFSFFFFCFKRFSGQVRLIQLFRQTREIRLYDHYINIFPAPVHVAICIRERKKLKNVKMFYRAHVLMAFYENMHKTLGFRNPRTSCTTTTLQAFQSEIRLKYLPFSNGTHRIRVICTRRPGAQLTTLKSRCVIIMSESRIRTKVRETERVLGENHTV